MAETQTTPPRNFAPPAPGASFEFRGKSYFLPMLCGTDRDEFHVWCNAQAWASYWALQPMVHEGVLTPAQWSEDRSLTDQRVKTGYYHLDEPGGLTFKYTRAGLTRLVWIGLKRFDPTTPLKVVQDMAAAHGEDWLLAQFNAANADPTAPSLATGASDGKSTPGSGDIAGTQPSGSAV